MEIQLKILFVCIGNTCRSPMAESVMRSMVKQSNLYWEVDSAALRTWNVGSKPEPRCIKVLKENNLSTNHIGRVITPEDFDYYDFILGMDDYNIRELKVLAKNIGKNVEHKIELLGSYIGRPEDKIIVDPYFSEGIGGFRAAYAQISESCLNFIKAHKYLLKGEL